jgi:hypothetical protein
MRSNYLKATLKAAIFAVTILLLTAGVSSAQTVNLTASQQTTTLPDGNTVPMWGWTCTGVTQGTTLGTSCTSLTYTNTAGVVALAPQIGGMVWQPPLIVVPYVAAGTNLTINLTNALPVETSLVIIGQSGGGLGGTAFGSGPGGIAGPVREAGPRMDGAHAGQTATTWTTVTPPPVGTFTPPTQGERVRSFVPEVAGVSLVGNAPLMGTYTWTGLKPGTYLMRTGTYPSIQGPMGLYGVVVVTTAPAAGAAGIAYPVTGSLTGVTYDADVVALESELDARQNTMVAALFPTACTAAGVPVAACTAAGPLPSGATTANAGFSETMKWTPECGAIVNGLTSTGAVPTCYPPAVDYTPKYFFINGVAFSRDNQQASALSVPAAGATGNVLVRYVNAGSHMHVPVVNNLNMLLVAEDGNVLPDVALALSNGKVLTAKPTALGATPSGLQVRNEVFQAAGKVYDVLVSPPQTKTSGMYDTATYPIFDRSLALATNGLAINGGGGMEAVLDVSDVGAANLAATNSVAKANADTYAYAPGVTLKVSDPGKGVIANDVNVYGVQLSTPAGAGTVTLYPNGTFTYVPTGSSTDSFGYCANGAVIPNAMLCTTVTLNMSATATAGNAPTANPDTFTSTVKSLMRVAAPGVLANDTDPHSYPLTAVIATPPSGMGFFQLNADGSLTAQPNAAGTAPCPTGTLAGANCYTFTYNAKNSQGISSTATTATLIFQPGSGLSVTVQDAPCAAAGGGAACAITDYKWIIEQDLTPKIDPLCQQNGPGGTKPANCPALPPTPATQFHTSYMPVIATGCTGPQSCEKGQTVYDAGVKCTSLSPNMPVGCSPTAGQHVMAACDGYGICTTGLAGLPMSLPSDANLTATNPDGSPASYYISILSGDSQNAFAYGNVSDPTVAGNCTPAAGKTEPSGITEISTCGHTMGGAPIPAPTVSGTTTTFAPVTVNLEPAPLKTATVTAWVFEDDFPLNGEPDGGGGVDVLATQEPGLGDFQIEIWDTAGGIGDNTGQMTYDMFNVPLTNSLNGTIDPNTGLNACPISNTQAGVGIGVIIVCPQYESDGQTLSPLVGQVVVRNLMQGKFTLIAHPGAVREAAGEEWVQTNSLDGGHFLDSFIKSGEPPYFQEYGPGGYHVFFAMANPSIINARLAAICNPSANNPPPSGTPFAPPCRNTINGQVTNLHQGRSPNEQLYGSGVFPQGNPANYAMLGYTQCFASLGDSDGATIAFAKCDQDGNFTFANVPDGNYGVVIFDNWDDIIVDGSSRPANVSGGQTINLQFPSFTWQTHLWNRTYMDVGGLGHPVLDNAGNLDPVLSPGLIQVPTRIRQTNGKFVNTLFSDIGGLTHFDETFPLFAWYNVESDTTRFRSTGVHAVNDAGGQLDGPTAGGGNGKTSFTDAYPALLNSTESFGLPTGPGPNLRYPGSYYCSNATCSDVTAPLTSTSGSGPGGSTGRIDPSSVDVEGWQGGVSEFDVIDWGKMPYMPGENGGIRGHVANSTTRPFDDPRMLFQNLWMPLVPYVTVNLYQENTAPDGTTSLTLVDTTQTTSWDSWAQGFHNVGTVASPILVPNMSCTGQDPVNDPFFSYTLAGTTNYLTPSTTLPYNSQYKCYDGYHNLNQVQPAPYDGLYEFPSSTCMTPGATFTVPGNPTPYNCATVKNPASGLTGAAGAGAKPAVLPSAANCAAAGLTCTGRYVVEEITPPNFELSKEEDLNLLIGDQYIAPVATQFAGAGLGNIYITPDQASIDAYNPSYTGPYTGGQSVAATFSILSSGAGYAVGNPLVFTGGGGSGAIASVSAVNATGGITSISLANPGNGYTVAPTVSVTSSTATSPANITASLVTTNGTSGPYSQPWNCPTPTTCTLNPSTTNNGKQSTDYGRTSFGSFGPGGLIQQSAPCVGLMRIVPDYLSIAPESGEVAPFAGSLRPLCDRKEVTLDDQMQANADFFIYTKTPKATSFTGFISDDFSSEFDPASPSFGEKFAIPNVPVSIRDFNGNEISRIYSDQFGTYNGLVYSTWEVDPPNITGYSPNIMSTCMNDPGPISGPNGTMINDPLYNPAYSIFCYHNPFMPGDTTYLDTPVVPTSAFAEGYNPPDCNYPDGTPGIKSVTGSSGVAGPWVSAPGATLTVTALGPQTVLNHAYSGPAANTAPYNQKFITRNYHFGTTPGTVTIGGVPATTVWGDTTLTVTVPTIPAAASTCPIQQRNVPAGTPPAYCGELVITAANGKQSIDSVTVTIGGKAPTVLTPGSTIQSAIDAAAPGDLIIVPPGTYTEMVLMWKPVQLQGVGASSSIVNANTYPAGKLLEPWRRQVVCLFGLTISGAVNGAPNPQTGVPNVFDPSGTFTCPATMQGQVDRQPGEATVGWDASLNGNLAELLQEPTLMGAYEGSAITVLGKGVRCPAGTDCQGTGAEAFFPAGTVVLTNSDADCNPSTTGFVGNFLCNPSRVDGLSFTNSSQGGGGVWLHGWNHFIEVANNRVYNNGGTLSGGITVGQAENPDAAGIDGTSLIDANGTELPYLYNMNVSVHNNSVTFNASYGDELGSNTPASAGGVSFCSGADYYRFNYNWVCGNLSSGNGGGFAHFGFNYNGHVEHNSFLFNQSINPTLTTYGGGAVFEGQGPDGNTINGLECGTTTDIDCPPGLSDGIGPGTVINANLFQGNTAEEGSGGGLELQHVNGTDVQRNPTNPNAWYQVMVTNNIFGNNVAGWDGGGVSLHDAILVNFINNTVVSNDATASAGVLFDSLGAPNANQPPHGCNPVTNPNCVGNQVTQSNFQPAGLATESHTANFLAAFTSSTVCPAGYSQCTTFSNPLLANDIFLQNRSFHIATAATAANPATSAGPVQLLPALSQTVTGGCPSGAMYWDIGVYGDTGPTDSSSGLKLSPTYSLLTVPGYYSGAKNNGPGSGPVVVSQYCNGSRVPPEIAPLLCSGPNGFANAPGCIQPGTVGLGITVPGGVPDSVPPPLPAFTLTPAATVDEGSNWINMFYGPLSSSNATIASGSAGYGIPLGDYAPAAGSAAIDQIPTSEPIPYPRTDFFGNPRPDPSNPDRFDIGAIEVTSGGVGAPTLTSISPASGLRGTTVAVTLTGTNLSSTAGVDAGSGIIVSGITVVSSTTVTANFAIATTAALGGTTVTVGTTGGAISNGVTFTVVGPTLTSISPSSGAAGTSVNVTLTGTNLSGGTGLAGLGTGVTVATGSFVVVNSTTITATLNIASTAPAGVRNIAVTTASNGTSTSVPFTVLRPTLTSIAPSSGQRGTSVNVTLTGTNLTGATSVNAPGSPNITVTNFVAVNATTVKATLNIALATSLGGHPITVTVNGAVSNAVTFTVTGISFSGPTPSLVTGTTTTHSGTITVTNSNPGSITVTAAPAVTKVGTAGGTFSITSGTCVSGFVVAGGGGTCTIIVQYNPGGVTTTATANVTLTDTGAATATQTSPNFTAN